MDYDPLLTETDRVSLRLQKGLVSRIDIVAEVRGEDRSQLIERAAENRINAYMHDDRFRAFIARKYEQGEISEIAAKTVLLGSPDADWGDTAPGETVELNDDATLQEYARAAVEEQRDVIPQGEVDGDASETEVPEGGLFDE